MGGGAIFIDLDLCLFLCFLVLLPMAVPMRLFPLVLFAIRVLFSRFFAFLRVGSCACLHHFLPLFFFIVFALALQGQFLFLFLFSTFSDPRCTRSRFAHSTLSFWVLLIFLVCLPSASYWGLSYVDLLFVCAIFPDVQEGVALLDLTPLSLCCLLLLAFILLSIGGVSCCSFLFFSFFFFAFLLLPSPSRLRFAPCI